MYGLSGTHLYKELDRRPTEQLICGINDQMMTMEIKKTDYHKDIT